MTIRTIQLPEALRCKVFGYLYSSANPRDLSDSMVTVDLATGFAVHCGWVPSGDMQGCYEISVTKGLEMIDRSVRTSDMEEAADHIQKLATLYSRDTMSCSPSTPVATSVIGNHSAELQD